jgi:hypothetical protein
MIKLFDAKYAQQKGFSNSLNRSSACLKYMQPPYSVSEVKAMAKDKSPKKEEKKQPAKKK